MKVFTVENGKCRTGAEVDSSDESWLPASHCIRLGDKPDQQLLPVVDFDSTAGPTIYHAAKTYVGRWMKPGLCNLPEDNANARHGFWEHNNLSCCVVVWRPGSRDEYTGPVNGWECCECEFFATLHYFPTRPQSCPACGSEDISPTWAPFPGEAIAWGIRADGVIENVSILPSNCPVIVDGNAWVFDGENLKEVSE